MEPDLEEIRNRAIQAFWASVDNSFPEIKTGDLNPLVVASFDNYADELIDTWLESNE